MSTSVKGTKTPWVAAVLALALGGPGCFYLGWRRGVKATFGWLFLVTCILVAARLPETAVFFLLLLQAALAAKVYKSAKRSNAEAAKAVGTGVPGTVGSKPLTGWKRGAWIFGKSVLQVVGAIAVIIGLFLTDLGLVDWHYARIERSVRSGMTIEEVLHTVREDGLVNGYPEYPEDVGVTDRKVIAFGGPSNGRYDLLSAPSREVSEAEAAALLQQNMVPGLNYKIGFTFTPGVGPHCSMTVRLSPEGRVKGVRPFHTWD